MSHTAIRWAFALALVVDAGSAIAYLDHAGPGLLRYVEARFGPPAPQRVVRWEHERVPGEPTDVLLAAINRKANAVPAHSDSEHWQQPDYWATPVEFVASNGGDCEDYAIAKYYALRAAGVPGERLRMTYVRALNAGRIENHMVLAYYASPGDDPLILDNLNPRVRRAAERPDLVPVFSFNDEDLRRGALPMLRRWQDLLLRMQAESEL